MSSPAPLTSQAPGEAPNPWCDCVEVEGARNGPRDMPLLLLVPCEGPSEVFEGSSGGHSSWGSGTCNGSSVPGRTQEENK